MCVRSSSNVFRVILNIVQYILYSTVVRVNKKKLKKKGAGAPARHARRVDRRLGQVQWTGAVKKKEKEKARKKLHVAIDRILQGRVPFRRRRKITKLKIKIP